MRRRGRRRSARVDRRRRPAAGKPGSRRSDGRDSSPRCGRACIGADRLVVGVEQHLPRRFAAADTPASRRSTNCSKNQLVCARCHFAGLASGIDCTIMSSALKPAQRLTVSWRHLQKPGGQVGLCQRAGTQYSRGRHGLPPSAGNDRTPLANPVALRQLKRLDDMRSRMADTSFTRCDRGSVDTASRVRFEDACSRPEVTHETRFVAACAAPVRRRVDGAGRLGQPRTAAAAGGLSADRPHQRVARRSMPAP